MSAYDPYDLPARERDRDRDHSRRYQSDRRERTEPRYADPPQDSYYRNTVTRTELVPRAREDSDLSVEEIHRDFPPPLGYSRDIRRARSAETGHDGYYYDQHRHHDRGSRSHKKPGSLTYEEEERTRKKRTLNKQEKIIAAVVGGVVAAGAKELWDRREAKEEGLEEINRNIAASAALGAAGALAGYQGADFYNKHATKEDKKSTYLVHKGRDGRIAEYYSDDEEDPRGHKGNKSFLENALSAAGLGGAIKALTGAGSDKDDRRSDMRSRRGSIDSRRSRSEDNPTQRMQKAAKASLVAGAAEAFRLSKEPGGWKGEKMKRVLTAAAGAATIDAAHDPSKDGKRHLMESVIGGLVGNRMLNGPRKDIEEDPRTGRSRSRSRARSGSRGGGGHSGIKALATAGLGAIGAKKILDSSRSRSRSRRGRGASPDSYDSREERSRTRSPRKRSRSRSIVDGARRSLAKIGLGSGPDDARSDARDDDYYDDRSSRKSRHRSPGDRYYDDDDDYTSRGYMRGGRGGDDYYDDDDRSAVSGRHRSRSRRGGSRGGRSSSASSTDLGDSDTDKKNTKKMRGKQLLTAGLASVATIHAASGVYASVGARNARRKAVKEGKLSPEEAKKLKSKAILQDAASVGVAAITIQGAVKELKEAREQNKAFNEWKEERKRRHEKRAERLRRLKDPSDNHSDDYDDGRSSRSSRRSRADNWSTSAPPRSRRYDDDGSYYTDGNPYSAALPAPPVGYDD